MRVCVYLIGTQQGGGRAEVPVVRAVLGGLIPLCLSSHIWP